MEGLSRQAALFEQRDVIDLTDSPASTPQKHRRSEPWKASSGPELSAPPATTRSADYRLPENIQPERSRDMQSRGSSNGTKEDKPVRHEQGGSSSAFALRPATVGAFGARAAGDTHVSASASKTSATTTGWPAWLVGSQHAPRNMKLAEPPAPREPEEGERFDIDAVRLSASDLERCDGDAEAHMRELLSGAIGAGEEALGEDSEGGDLVEGFAKGIRLMPHQVRGVRWMRSREANRKTGGILADVSI